MAKGDLWVLYRKKTWGKFGLRPSYTGYISFAIATWGFKSEHLPRWKTNENREKIYPAIHHDTIDKCKTLPQIGLGGV